MFQLRWGIVSSIQLTVDTYGKWLPMGNKAVNRLDEGDWLAKW